MREKQVGDIVRHPDSGDFFANEDIDTGDWVGVVAAELHVTCALGECRVIWIDQPGHSSHYLAADLLIYCPGYSLGGI